MIFARLNILQEHLEQIKIQLSLSSIYGALDIIQNNTNARINNVNLRINATNSMLIDVKKQLRNLSDQVQSMQEEIRITGQHNEETAVSSPTEPDELH
ncbi:hypothetical protein Q9L58_006836 [Maublancomyces gigas]|uniref:Uncharacterized protein n=1 Tax=Discina gigas TaxID=1032678 RepID=A0ABR3GE82_9PEZI